jgi:predicted DNA-binding transcriptional regulator AlpA
MKPKAQLASSETQGDHLLTTVRPILESGSLLTSKEVAALIGKSESWLIRKRWEGGGIPYRKIGRHVRYEAQTVREWLLSQPLLTSTSDHR